MRYCLLFTLLTITWCASVRVSAQFISSPDNFPELGVDTYYTLRPNVPVRSVATYNLHQQNFVWGAISDSASVSTGALVAAGLGGAILGTLAGAAAGAALANDQSIPGTAFGAVTGAVALNTIVIPLSVSLRNKNMNRFGRMAAWSALAGAGIMGLTLQSGDIEGIVLIPIIQLAISVSIANKQ